MNPLIKSSQENKTRFQTYPIWKKKRINKHPSVPLRLPTPWIGPSANACCPDQWTLQSSVPPGCSAGSLFGHDFGAAKKTWDIDDLNLAVEDQWIIINLQTILRITMTRNTKLAKCQNTCGSFGDGLFWMPMDAVKLLHLLLHLLMQPLVRACCIHRTSTLQRRTLGPT